MLTNSLNVTILSVAVQVRDGELMDSRNWLATEFLLLMFMAVSFATKLKAGGSKRHTKKSKVPENIFQKPSREVVSYQVYRFEIGSIKLSILYQIVLFTAVE